MMITLELLFLVFHEKCILWHLNRTALASSLIMGHMFFFACVNKKKLLQKKKYCQPLT